MANPRVTIFVDKNRNESKMNENPEKTVINELAIVISHLEDRLAHMEQIILGKSREKEIKIIEK